MYDIGLRLSPRKRFKTMIRILYTIGVFTLGECFYYYNVKILGFLLDILIFVFAMW